MADSPKRLAVSATKSSDGARHWPWTIVELRERPRPKHRWRSLTTALRRMWIPSACPMHTPLQSRATQPPGGIVDNCCYPSGVPPLPLTSICVTPVRRRPGTRAVARACCGTGFQLFSSELLSKTTFLANDDRKRRGARGHNHRRQKSGDPVDKGTGQLTKKPS